MDKVKVAFIGAGALANQAHYPSVAGFEDVQIVGLCDLDEKRRAQTAERFGIADTFSDYRHMLDQTRPDAVYALMPPHHVFDVAMEVLVRKHALFIEKPPGVSTVQAEALGRMAQDQGVITAVGFQRRYHPMLRECFQRVCAKGAIHQVVANIYKNDPPQQVHPYYRGTIDILHCDAIHAVDGLRYYAGLSDVKAVSSEVRTLDCWYPVAFNALVEFDNGAVGVLLANWRSGRRFFKFEFHGFGAAAFADLDGEGTVWADDAEEPALRTTHAQFAGSDEWHVNQGFCAEGRAFIDAAKSGTQLHNNFQDAAKSMALVDMIYENAINRR